VESIKAAVVAALPDAAGLPQLPSVQDAWKVHVDPLVVHCPDSEAPLAVPVQCVWPLPNCTDVPENEPLNVPASQASETPQPFCVTVHDETGQFP
jgi:hypothetical protein